MKPKILKFDAQARELLLEGAKELAKAVASTMGPRGRVVVTLDKNGNPIATKDGISVANEVSFRNKFKDAGAQLVKQAADATASEAGDGTTASTVLAASLFEIVHGLIGAGHDPVLLKKGIDTALVDIIKALKEISKPCKAFKTIKQVATISCNSDLNIGELIAKAMTKVGSSGTITVEESPTFEDTIEIVDGMRYKKGAISPFFLTTGDRGKVVLNNPYVLVTNKTLSSIRDLIQLLEEISKQGRSLLIIANGVEREALQVLIHNHVKGVLTSVAVEPPEMGELRQMALRDLALLVGTEVICDEQGQELESLQTSALGGVEKAIITGGSTTLIKWKGDENKIKLRIEELEEEKKNKKDFFWKEKTQERIARLTGGVAVIKLGASTELALREKLDRVDDALHATQAAVEEGFIPGEGVTLYKIGHSLTESNFDLTTIKNSRRAGYVALCLAATKPFEQILINSGISLKPLAIGDFTDLSIGIDVDTGEYLNLIDAGIIDPTKVARVALQNAVSVVGLMITTSCVIVEEEDKHETCRRN